MNYKNRQVKKKNIRKRIANRELKNKDIEKRVQKKGKLEEGIMDI